MINMFTIDDFLGLKVTKMVVVKWKPHNYGFVAKKTSDKNLAYTGVWVTMTNNDKDEMD